MNTIEHVVFDYNGTLAESGIIRSTTRERVRQLTELFSVHIITADTFGTVVEQMNDLPVTLKILKDTDTGNAKEQYVKALGADITACVGNGRNDICMCRRAVFSIAVIGKEGCYGKLLSVATVAVTSIDDAFVLLLDPLKRKATTRE